MLSKHAEDPILDDLLVLRIARAHGFQRSGRQINERVIGLAKRYHYFSKGQIEGHFVWQSHDAALNWPSFRVPETDGDVRRIEEIAFEELHATIPMSFKDGLPIEIARTFWDSPRLSVSARKRLEAVIQESVSQASDIV